MRNYIIAHQDRLTDFNDGSVLASHIEATARELALLYMRCRVGFSSYLRSLPYSVFGFKMKEGLKASTKVILSRSKPFSYDTTIPAGTIIRAGDLNFLTSEIGTVPSGETSSKAILAIAENTGDKYNVSAGTIKTIVSTLSADIVAVNNEIPATGGENAEDFSSYMDRFSDYIIGLQRTNMSGILSALTSGHLVRSMTIDEHFPPLDNIWNMTLYLEDGSGAMTEQALSEAKKLIDGDVIQNICGYRAPGVNIRYLTPEIIPITVYVSVTAEYDVANEVDESVIVNVVTETIQKHINSLKIGKNVCTSDLIVVLKRLHILEDAHITFPTEDTIIELNQIARYEDCVVKVQT